MKFINSLFKIISTTKIFKKNLKITSKLFLKI